MKRPAFRNAALRNAALKNAVFRNAGKGKGGQDAPVLLLKRIQHLRDRQALVGNVRANVGLCKDPPTRDTGL